MGFSITASRRRDTQEEREILVKFNQIPIKLRLKLKSLLQTLLLLYPPPNGLDLGLDLDWIKDRYKLLKIKCKQLISL